MNAPFRPRVGVDVDDVLADLLPVLLRFLNARYGTAYTGDDLHEWSLTPLLREGDVADFWRDFGATDVHAALRPCPGAVEGLAALAAVADVYLVTTPLDGARTWVDDRRVWLREHFGIDSTRVIHTHAKSTFAGHALVDDNPAHVRAWQDAHPAGRGILWDRPCNRAADVRHRAAGWDTVRVLVTGEPALDLFASPAVKHLTYYGLPVSLAGARCARLLDVWLDGLHHFPGGQRALRAVDWSQDFVTVSLCNEVSMSTCDFDGLTRLVFLAHDHAIRIEVQPAMRTLRILLHPRARIGGAAVAHPTLDRAVAHHVARNAALSALTPVTRPSLVPPDAFDTPALQALRDLLGRALAPAGAPPVPIALTWRLDDAGTHRLYVAYATDAHGHPHDATPVGKGPSKMRALRDLRDKVMATDFAALVSRLGSAGQLWQDDTDPESDARLRLSGAKNIHRLRLTPALAVLRSGLVRHETLVATLRDAGALIDMPRR